MISDFLRSVGLKKPLKHYKITIDRHQVYGVLVDSLQTLKDEAFKKLKIENCRVLLAKDGTIVDDETYFSSIEPNTLFLITSNASPKKYEITSIDRQQTRQVVADSLKMLKDTASKELRIENCRIFLSEDGTEVDNEEYFSTIEPETLFVIATDAGQVKSDVQLLLEAKQNEIFQSCYASEIIETFVNGHRSEVKKIVEQSLAKLMEMNAKMNASKRDEHCEWFEGIPESLKTKEAVMARRSQDRIRGYFHKASTHFKKSDVYKKSIAARRLIDELLEIFQYFLIGVDYFSSLFNRKCENRYKSGPKPKNTDDVDAPQRKKAKRDEIHRTFDAELKKKYCVSLCDEQGKFQCHGQFNKTKCQYPNHQINPYASRENAITFQVWNLDHQIEMTRTVIQKILDDVCSITKKVQCKKHDRPAKMLSAVQYFLELFTVHNLRLVHIVCHEKVARDKSSEGTILCEECEEFKFIQNTMKEIAG